MGEKRKGRGGKGRDDDDEEGGGWKPGGQKQYKGGHSVGTGAQPFPKATPRHALFFRAVRLPHILWGHRCSLTFRGDTVVVAAVSAAGRCCLCQPPPPLTGCRRCSPCRPGCDERRFPSSHQVGPRFAAGGRVCVGALFSENVSYYKQVSSTKLMQNGAAVVVASFY